MSRIIKIPDWCKIGLYIEFCDPTVTGSTDWYKEKIVGYSDSGFFIKIVIVLYIILNFQIQNIIV